MHKFKSTDPWPLKISRTKQYNGGFVACNKDLVYNEDINTTKTEHIA